MSTIPIARRSIDWLDVGLRPLVWLLLAGAYVYYVLSGDFKQRRNGVIGSTE